MKLYPALKDPTMRFPRVANYLLDAGMVLLVLGGIGLCASTIACWCSSRSAYADYSLTAFIVGSVAYIAARMVARLKRDPVEPCQRRELRIVK